jgi:hypothetical protein
MRLSVICALTLALCAPAAASAGDDRRPDKSIGQRVTERVFPSVYQRLLYGVLPQSKCGGLEVNCRHANLGREELADASDQLP